MKDGLETAGEGIMILPKFDEKWESEWDEISDFCYFFKGRLIEDYLKWKKGDFINISLDLQLNEIVLYVFNTDNEVERIKIDLIEVK